jgi:hypothetical protein
MLLLAEASSWQPLASILGPTFAATIAVFGVKATLKQNRQEQENEHREKRRLDRYTRLFSLYGDFYAAASDYLMNMNSLIATQTWLVAQTPLTNITGIPPDEASMRKRIRVEDHAEELRKVCLDRQAAMQAALSRLSLMNDAQARMDIPLHDIVRVNNITAASSSKDLNKVRLDLRNRQQKLGYDLAVAYELPANTFSEIVD